MLQPDNGLRLSPTAISQPWHGSVEALAFTGQEIKACLTNLEQPCYIVERAGQTGATNVAPVWENYQAAPQGETRAMVAPLALHQFGDPTFLQAHGVRYAYTGGAMANAISSEEMVIAFGRAGMLCSFGAAGLVPTRLTAAIQRIQQALPNGPYAFNLIHSPSEEALEQNAVELYLKHQVQTVEASAFLALTPHLVRYRAAGLRLNQQNQIEIQNRIIAKISRTEVASQFLQPAPAKLLQPLVAAGLITAQQAELAEHVPVADDVTAEADSGGHTDNRPLVSLLPAILALRDELQAKYQFAQPVRVGAGGGISTPAAALGAFMMGAAYLVTGSVNQACTEAGASEHTRKLLAEAGMADVMMAPAADMFEMGVKLQVLKKGTLFPMRAQKLYELYQRYDSLETLPKDEREKLERQLFRRNLDVVWEDTVAYFKERDPEQIQRAQENPKRKMALVFRWYLGLSSRWSNTGEKGREMDYQIWAGPALGAFNAWVRNSYLAQPENRHVVEVAHHILTGAALLYRVQSLRLQGVYLPPFYAQYQPMPLTKPHL